MTLSWHDPVGNDRRNVSQPLPRSGTGYMRIAALVVHLYHYITFPILLNSIGLGLSYGIYAAFGLIAFFFVKNFVDETMGKTLEEMSKEKDEEE